MISPRQDDWAPLFDSFGRRHNNLRISVTDRCNIRCFYCMPEQVQFKPREELLTFEEIERLTSVFVRLGVNKLRLTGGEPLVRPQLEQLIERIASVDGIRDIALTTNGSLLTAGRVPGPDDRARILREAEATACDVQVTGAVSYRREGAGPDFARMISVRTGPGQLLVMLGPSASGKGQVMMSADVPLVRSLARSLVISVERRMAQDALGHRAERPPDAVAMRKARAGQGHGDRGSAGP